MKNKKNNVSRFGLCLHVSLNSQSKEDRCDKDRITIIKVEFQKFNIHFKTILAIPEGLSYFKPYQKSNNKYVWTSTTCTLRSKITDKC